MTWMFHTFNFFKYITRQKEKNICYKYINIIKKIICNRKQQNMFAEMSKSDIMFGL